ncbi:SGNH/GDSL hydrolase family protein [Plastoroseomonas arctica]|uniref:SGNH/GDSL hydrolase family protein n=1 Tax=Plastoroseomonas arctica TaxID=1509237 RepID=A0AAF1KUZ0_9PROT|nr:SGNH/GDSL hydrolase family protein [Plastoroseomonas arctica]MBR0657477.1 SGNH/GDSL hydrolase family protein [Plastoroseomonas arctica]
MRRLAKRLVVAMQAGALLALLAAPARASICDVPPELVDSPVPLEATARGLRRGVLRVLVVGSASVFGPGGSGPDAAWPGQFATRLREGWPGLRVELEVRGARGMMADEMLAMILAVTTPRPHLVVWQAGSVEAARGQDTDWLARRLNTGLEALRERGIDAVLMDQQFSRFMRANSDVDSYRDALRMAGSVHGAALLQRYAMMQHWAESERIDIERTPRERRVAATDQLHACLGRALARLVLDGAADAGAPSPDNAQRPGPPQSDAAPRP